MAGNFSYVENRGFENSESIDIWTLGKDRKRLKTYSFEEAVNLTGNGKYNVGLLATTSLSILAMSLDMFGFSVVVSGCACEFELDESRKKILMSMPLLGAIIMSYPWGYISDTRGRRVSLLIAMWGGFVSAALCAFSTNWIMMAVFKFFSTSFCTCAQSATYALLGESCPEKVKDFYMFVMTSILNLSFPIYVALGYFSVKYPFALDFGFIMFSSWRLLALTLAIPLGLSGICLLFYCESPKFLLNIGRNEEALNSLAKIWRWNQGSGKKYPVENLALAEDGEVSRGPLCQSLWEQTAPLFRKPWLLRTLQLYFITQVIYSATNSLFVWFPFLSNAFITGISSGGENEVKVEGLCNIITSSHQMNNTDDALSCVPKTDLAIVWSSLAQGVTFVFISLAISKVAHRRRTLMITILAISGVACVGSAAITNNVASLIMFFVIFLCILATGVLFSYFVALYPTSYRGMAACVAVLVARASGLAGLNLVGTYILAHCDLTFYALGANFFCAVVVAWFLPPDNVKKVK